MELPRFSLVFALFAAGALPGLTTPSSAGAAALTPGTASASYNPATGELFFLLGENIGVVGFETQGLFDVGASTWADGLAPTQFDDNVLAYFNPTGLTPGQWSLGARLPAGLPPTPGLINFGYTAIGQPSVMAPITWLVGDATIDVDPWTTPEPVAPAPIDPPVFTPPANPLPIVPPTPEPPSVPPTPVPGNHGVATAKYFAATGELSITLGHNIGVVGFETGGLFDSTYQTPSDGRAPSQSDSNVVAYFDPTGLAVGEWSLGARLPAGLAPTPGLINFGYTPIGSPSVEAAIEWVLDDGSVFVPPFVAPTPPAPVEPWPPIVESPIVPTPAPPWGAEGPGEPPANPLPEPPPTPAPPTPPLVSGNHGVATAKYFAATGELSITLGHNIGVVGFETGGLFDPAYQTPQIDEGAFTQSDPNVLAYFDPTGLADGEWNLGARLPAGLPPTPGLINFGYTPIGSPSVEAAIEWVLDDGSIFVEPYIEPAPSMPIDPWPQEGPWETPATPPVVGEPQEPILPSPDPIDPPTYTEETPAITRPWWPGVIDPTVPSYPEGELVIDPDLKLWLVNLIDVDFRLGGNLIDFDGTLHLRRFVNSVTLTDVLTSGGVSADSYGTAFIQLASASGQQVLTGATGRALANADERTIPEPSAFALAGIAALGVMTRRRP